MQSSRAEPFVHRGPEEVLITWDEDEYKEAVAKSKKRGQMYLFLCILVFCAPFILLTAALSIFFFLLLVRLFP
jgi:hypothetical protein